MLIDICPLYWVVMILPSEKIVPWLSILMEIIHILQFLIDCCMEVVWYMQIVPLS